MKPLILRFWPSIAAILLGCASPGSNSHQDARLALDSVLSSDRRAHLETNAALLASHLAETLITIDAGHITEQLRDSVLAQFQRYFADVEYHAWIDVEPPRIQLAEDGSLAWVARTVCVDRDEPDSLGGRRRRVFVTAYDATYQRRAGRWLMSAVGSTFRVPSPARCSSEGAP